MTKQKTIPIKLKVKTVSASPIQFDQQRFLFEAEDLYVMIDLELKSEYFWNFEPLSLWALGQADKKPDPILTEEGFYALTKKLEHPFEQETHKPNQEIDENEFDDWSD